MKKIGMLKAVVILAVIYFLWLFIVAVNDALGGGGILVDLKTWSLIGIALYAILLIVELMVYFLIPGEEKEEIKVVSEVIKQVTCSNCNTVFKISDTGVRPLKYTCPNCGMEGVLRGKKVEGVKKIITCESCSNSFEVLDSGERPLKYICPICHYEGEI